MKKRKRLIAILSVALLISMIPGNSNRAKADDKEGNVQEILLVKGQKEGKSEELTEVFRTYSDEGEVSEALNQEALEEWRNTSDTAILIIGRDGQELEKEEDKQPAISESQQHIIAQVAEDFDQLVVVFNNFRPYGLEIMNDYASIKTVTMIESADEKEMLSAASQLCEIVSGGKADSNEVGEDTLSTDLSQTGTEGTEQSQSGESEAKQSSINQTEQKQQDPELQTETSPSEQAENETEATEKQTLESEGLKSTEAVSGKVNTKQKNNKQDKKYKMGDINGDGMINTLDASVLMQMDKEKVTKEVLAYCDVNGDKKINAKDVDMILKYATGEITEFKVSKKLEGKR